MNSLKSLNSSNTIYGMVDVHVPYILTVMTFPTPHGTRTVNMYVVYVLIAHLLQGSGDLEVHWSLLVCL